jgi:CubicO group peptidase (beta-lactamase class C family)
MPFVHSILIVRHGYLVFEQYFAGYNETSLNEMMSVTKSVTSALVGIALERGDIQNVDVTFASSPSRR